MPSPCGSHLSVPHFPPKNGAAGSCCVIVRTQALGRHKPAPVQGPDSTARREGSEVGPAWGCSWPSRHKGALQKPSISARAAPAARHSCWQGLCPVNTNRKGGTAPAPLPVFALLGSGCFSLTQLGSPSPQPFFSSFFPEPSVALKLSQQKCKTPVSSRTILESFAHGLHNCLPAPKGAPALSHAPQWRTVLACEAAVVCSWRK